MPLFLLAVVFIILKVTDTIGWSWWWVLSPLIALAVIRVILGVEAEHKRRR